MQQRAGGVPPLSVGIVGAGLSGMCAGLRMQQAGVPFTIFEKGPEVGGTWRENRYPGLTIDVPAPLYTFKDQRHAGWRRWMPGHREILEYFADVATTTGLRDNIRFDRPVTAATWTGDRWLVTAGDEQHEFRVLVCATGFLHQPSWPDFEGLDSFAGELVHSAQWRDDIVTQGRRVGVVGSGSTGVQLVGALGGVASHLTLFQRTAQWIFPVANFPIPGVARRVQAARPQLMDSMVEGLLRLADRLVGQATVHDGWRRRALGRVAQWHLSTVRDSELRAILTPPDVPLCKRPVVSTRFYKAVQRPDVSVVPAAIQRVIPEGVVTADGKTHELDVLILATGFQAHQYMRPIAITGENGLTLDEAWAEGPHGYNTIALAGFPNLFMVMGPHSPLVSISIHESAELQSDYIAQMLDVIDRDDVVSVSPTPEATDRWLQSIRDGMPGTVWSSGCTSWYLGSLETPVLWPYDRPGWQRLLRTPDLSDYEIRTIDAPVPAAA